MNIDPKVTIENVAFSEIDGCAIFNKDSQDNPNLTNTNNTESSTDGLLCNE